MKIDTDAAAAGAAAATAAASAAASAACIYYVIIGGRFAPPYKYMIKCIQQKQQQLQQQPQQLQGHFGNFFENVWPHLAWPHVAFSEPLSFVALRPLLCCHAVVQKLARSWE